MQFEKGDITLYEWVPVKIKINALLSKKQRIDIENSLEVCSLVKHSQPEQETQTTENFKEINYDEYVTIEQGDISTKMTIYEELVISMITDQWNWIKDKSHTRVISNVNAIESLRIAEEATQASSIF